MSPRAFQSLYAELGRYIVDYIVDYNVGLFNELEENKRSQFNYSFYSAIVPPNKISYEISAIQKEIDIYKKDILESESKV